MPVNNETDTGNGFWLHPTTLRIIYILSALAVSHSVAFLSLAEVQTWLSNIFVNPQLKPGAAAFLEPEISGAMLIVGEFAYRYFHQKVILPKITPVSPTVISSQQTQEVKP